MKEIIRLQKDGHIVNVFERFTKYRELNIMDPINNNIKWQRRRTFNRFKQYTYGNKYLR